MSTVLTQPSLEPLVNQNNEVNQFWSHWFFNVAQNRVLVLQKQIKVITASNTTNKTIPFDGSAPKWSEGDLSSIFITSFTPKRTDSKLLFEIHTQVGLENYDTEGTLAVFESAGSTLYEPPFERVNADMEAIMAFPVISPDVPLTNGFVSSPVNVSFIRNSQFKIPRNYHTRFGASSGYMYLSGVRNPTTPSQGSGFYTGVVDQQIFSITEFLIK